MFKRKSRNFNDLYFASVGPPTHNGWRLLLGFLRPVGILDTGFDVQYNYYVVLDGEVAVPCTRNPL